MKRSLPLLVVAAAAVLSGCSSTSRKTPLQVFADMKRQLRYNPQAESPLFADGRASRPPVPGTVSRDDLEPVKPLPYTREVLAHGQERFNIYCAPCHDQTGSGQGIVGIRSGWIASNLTEPRIRDMADSQIFETITNGRRTMPAYRFQVPEQDRWAIVAYVRALQRAATGTVADVPQELQSELR